METLALKELEVSRIYTSTLPGAQSQTPANFIVKSEFLTGNWCNAIQASLNYGTDGAAAGIGATLSADLILPNKSFPSGAYYCAHLSFGAQASSDWNGILDPVAFLRLENWGTATTFDLQGSLIHMEGMVEGDGKLYSLGTGGGAPTVVGTIRINVNGGYQYLCLASKAAID